MTLTKGKTDELILVTAMPVLGQAAGANLDSGVLVAENANHDFPLRLFASATPDAFLNISASTTTMGDGGNKIVAPVSGVGPAAFASGKINMGTGALTGLGTITLNGGTFATTFAALTKTNGQYRRFVFCLQSTGTLAVASTAESSTEAGLADWGALATSTGGTFTGYVDVVWVSASTQYKTPSASGNTIGNDGIYRVGGAGGGGGGSTSGYATTAVSGGTTILTATSAQRQYFTGSGGQTIVMPATSTLTLGQVFVIVNNTTGTISVTASDSSTIYGNLPANSTMQLTSVSTSVTSFAGWTATVDYNPFSGYQTPTPLPVIAGGTGVATSTGTGNAVLSSAPTLSAPVLNIMALQSASNPNITVSAGILPLADGRELAHWDGTGTATTDFGSGLAFSATTQLAASPTSIGGGGTPANSTLYYLYIDLDSLPSTPTTITSGTQIGRLLYPVVSTNYVLGTTAPLSVNRSRYVPRGQIYTTASGAWSGSGAELISPATIQGNNGPTAVSPVVYTLGKQLISAPGTSGQIAAGHILSTKSWPTALAQATQVSWFNLAANANDGSANGKNLTNVGSAPFTGTNIFGTANAAALLNGSTQYFSSTSAFFNPGDVPFSFGLWVAPTSWTAVQVLMAQEPSNSDKGFALYLNGGSGALSLDMALTSTTVATFTPITALGFTNNKPHHFAVSYQTGGTWTIYVDGKSVGSFNNGVAQRVVTSPLLQVGAFNSGTNTVNGVIEDVFFVNGYAMSDTDIQKLYSYRLDHNAGVATKNQEWIGNVYTDTDLVKQLPLSGPGNALIDITDSNSAFFDFSQYNGTLDSVELKLKDTGLSPTVVTPVPPYDVTYTATPAATTAHGQPDIPDIVILVETGTANTWDQMPSNGLVTVDATNFYLNTSDPIFAAVATQPNRLRIIARPARLASVGVPQAQPARLGQVTSFTPLCKSAVLATSSGYTVLDNDGYSTFLVTTGSSTITMVLPAAANNSGRTLTFKKVDSGSGKIVISRAGSDLIDGATTNELGNGAANQFAFLTLVSDGVGWRVVAMSLEVLSALVTSTISNGGTAGVYTDSSQTLTVPPGNWRIEAISNITASGNASWTTGNIFTTLALRDSGGTVWDVAVLSAWFPNNSASQTMGIKLAANVSLTAAATYKLSISSNQINNSTGATTQSYASGTAPTSNTGNVFNVLVATRRF